MTCILLGTVPSVVIGAFSYHKASQIIQKKVDGGCISQLQQVQIAVETQLTSARKVLLQMIGSPVVTQSAGVEKSGLEFESFQTIENTINSLPPATIPFYNVSLINVGHEWVVDKTNISSLASYEQLNPSVADYIQNSKKSFWNDESLVYDPNGRLAARCVSVVQKYQNREGNYIGTIDIPYDGFASLINATGPSEIILILGTKGQVIFSGHPEISAEFSGNIIPLIRQDTGASGNLEMKTKNAVWNLTYMRSNYNHWYYILATPMDEITKDSKSIQIFTFFVCVSLICLIVFVSFLISSRAYRPIQRLSDVLKRETVSGPPHCGDEVQQIESGVKHLITDHSKLQGQILSQSEKLREYFVTTLLTQESSADFIQSRTSLYGFPCPPPQTAVLVIQPDSLKGTPYRESDTDILLYAISNITAELFAGHAVILTAILDGRQVTLLSVESEEYKDAVYRYAKRIQQTLQSELEFGVSVIISRPVASYGELHRNYSECVHILRYRILGGKSVAFAEDVNKNHDFNSVYPQELEEEIINAAKTCDRVKCREMIHQFLTTIFDIQANRCFYKIFLLRLTVNLMTLGNPADADPCCGESEYAAQIYSMHDRDQIEDWMQNTVMESVIQGIEKSEDNHLRQICNAVLEIIHTEYSSKLTLEACARRLNYHPSYIRHVLKKEMGINFRDYLLQYRIDIAKKWLVGTEYSVADIARKLQYENTENFIRSFKKVVGCTPGQFKSSRNSR